MTPRYLIRVDRLDRMHIMSATKGRGGFQSLCRRLLKLPKGIHPRWLLVTPNDMLAMQIAVRHYKKGGWQTLFKKLLRNTI
jgi:hypothetical protein